MTHDTLIATVYRMHFDTAEIIHSKLNSNSCELDQAIHI